MKNSLSTLAAVAVLWSSTAMPAAAGYTIYEDKALPSVLFVEFDGAPPSDTDVIRAPSYAPTGAPDLVSGTQVQRGDEEVAEEEQAEPPRSDLEVFNDSLDDAASIDSDSYRDMVIEDAVRRDVFGDGDLSLR